MRLKANSSEQKLRGAYYTPKALAEFMITHLPHNEGNHILEPSCGDGVFVDTYYEQHGDSCAITAIEIEADEAEKVRSNHPNQPGLNVLTKDFFDYYKRTLGEETFDLILGNPPYIRYQYLTEKQRAIQSEILTSHGMKSNKLINAWVAFLVACVQLLNENGKIAFVIPAEILQVAYAEDLRLYLANNLSRITLVAFKQLVFPEIEQEVLVLIGEKGGGDSGIRIIEVEDLKGLQNIDFEREKFCPILHVKEKWTKYFVNADEMNIIQKIRHDNRFVKFADYGLINVGITTGNNKYFSVDEKTADEYDLKSVSLPLIGRSSHAHGIYFTQDDWELNIKNGKRAFLINFPDIPIDEYSEGHRRYISFGEENGEHDGYKCSIRDRWYIVPSVWVPDAFFLRRNNLYPKFVINKCGAVSTDTMHRMKFNDGVHPNHVLLSYYNSISFAFTEICGRSYGGGVLEILPGEMGNIVLPKITEVDYELETELLSFIDKVVRNDENIEDALDLVDRKLLVEQLNIPEQWCNDCREIWKKLQRRRLGRG
jgi:adenine-specific DNA-methyltransferase